MLTACAGPGPRQVAEREGMVASEVEAGGFRHTVFRKPGQGSRLHIYLGGDGRPWVDGRFPAADPTGDNALVMELMALDPAPAVYLGRPCYFGTADDPGCEPRLWTARRYAPEVLGSMALAARQLIADGGYREAVLIGYSGGGVLALLLAGQLPEVVGVLTLAANLDTVAWTAHHGYLPLRGSLNPALLPDVPPGGVPHVQVIGLEDEVVPPSVTAAYRARKGNLEVWEYPAYDHVCCWEADWPAILDRFNGKLAAGPR